MSFMKEAGITLEAPFFKSARQNDWEPLFHWTGQVADCAERINRPHEDYPRRIPDTERAIQYVMDLNLREEGKIAITQELVREVHRLMFPDHGARAGQWRQLNVRVATHLAPKWELMDNMMAELEHHYRPLELDEESLKKWYFDFETIHPYRDGNGRVGGAVIAGISFGRHRKFLTPGQ